MEKSIMIKDIIRENDPNAEVIVRGVNPVDDYDPHSEDYFHGKLGEIPEILQQCDVLQTAWSFGSQCHIIHIAHTPIMEKFEYNKAYPFQVFVKKLEGSEGGTVGRYLRLPITDEKMKEAFEHVGVETADDFSRYDEKWRVHDRMDCYVPGLEDKLESMINSSVNFEELNYLAAELKNMPPEEYQRFCAAVEVGDHTGSLQELINLRFNLPYYRVNPDIKSYVDLGKLYVQNVPEELKDFIDYEKYGRKVAKDNGGKVTKYGYATNPRGRFDEVYDGNPENIPEEYRVMSKPREQEQTAAPAAEPKAEEVPSILPTITCLWSESPVFEDGKTYSVGEFDRLMKEADAERVAGTAAAIEKYGSAEAWYNSDVQDEYTQYYGYDKVKFTVNMPNGTTYTERQDIGDGYGGVIDFLRRIPLYSGIASALETAVLEEAAEAPVQNEPQSEIGTWTPGGGGYDDSEPINPSEPAEAQEQPLEPGLTMTL